MKLTYDTKGVLKACINPSHPTTTSPTILHVLPCMWKDNLKVLAEPTLDKPKRYSYCHRFCENCLEEFGPTYMRCKTTQQQVNPYVEVLNAEDTITSLEGFLSSVQKCKQFKEITKDAKYLVIHCSLVGKEAQNFRQKLDDLKSTTTIHIVYSNIDNGCGINLREHATHKDTWQT